MPSTKRSIDRASVSNPGGAGGEPLGETPATPSGILERMPDEIRRKLPDEVVDELLAGARTEEEIVGPGGLLSQLTKRLVERAMEVELTDHVGYEPHQEPPGGAGNTRNGSTPKTLITKPVGNAAQPRRLPSTRPLPIGGAPTTAAESAECLHYVRQASMGQPVATGGIRADDS